MMFELAQLAWRAAMIWFLRRFREFRDMEARERVVTIYFNETPRRLASTNEIRTAVLRLLEQRGPLGVMFDVHVESVDRGFVRVRVHERGHDAL